MRSVSCMAVLLIVMAARLLAGDEMPTPDETLTKIKLLGGEVAWREVSPGHSTVVGIDFRGSGRLSDGFLHVVTTFETLERLSLDDTPVTPEGLRQLRGIRTLKQLGLRNVPVTDESLEELKAHRALKEVDLSGTKVTEAGKAALQEARPGLWIIDEAQSIRELEQLNGAIERHSDLPGRPVRSLRLRTDHEFRQFRLLRGFKHVRYLAIYAQGEIPENWHEELPRFRELADLHLSGTPISDAVLKTVGGLSTLTSLELVNCSRISDAGLKSVGCLPALKSLRLVNCSPISDTGLRDIRTLQNLTDIELEGNELLTDVGLRELSHMKGLKRISVGGYGITDAGLESFAELPALESLSVTGQRITDRGMATVGKLHQLRSLDLSLTQVTDIGMRKLRDLSELTGLSLSQTKVTEAGLMELRSPKLELLNFNKNSATVAICRALGEHRNLRYLSLADTDITDEALKELTPLENLETLSLDGCEKLTDAGIKELRILPNLKSLRVSGMTPEQMRTLQAELPGVILWREL